MTGTSLDGVDLALCEFGENSFKIIQFDCLNFPPEMQKSIREIHLKSASEYLRLENAYSRFLSKGIRQFNESTGRKSQFSGIHGQTVFHEPSAGLTTQMLNGGLIAALTGIPTVCDFRRADVALGGQGAPLVPIGDRDLFSDYSACLNLGGFANVSLEENEKRVAFDICPVNFVLNQLAEKEGLEYDDKGKMAASGELDKPLLQELNDLEYYHRKSNKSLGREWVEQEVIPLLRGKNNRTALRTFTAHAAHQIAESLANKDSVLVTGGGSYNEFLMKQLSLQLPDTALIIPEKKLLEGKEALIFAYLAKLRLERKINVLASATGALRDSSSGAIYFPS